MAAASPSVSRSSGGRGAALAHAETRPRTMVGLHRADVQLQHKLERIDRQAFTAVSNIANHQQAMKMSWRRLEAQRNSPKMSQRTRSRSLSDQQVAGPRRSLLSSNNTRLYVSATPQVYFGRGSRLPGDQGHTAGEDRKTRDDSDVGSSSSHSSLYPPTIPASPFISSPYMYRRRSDEMKETEPSPLVRSQAQGASFKLPPILTSSSQPSLVATTKKDTLLKMSHIMGLDSHSLTPKSFDDFYTGRDPVHSRGMELVHTLGQDEDREEGEGREGKEEGEGEGEGEGEDGRVLSLAEQFEQIKKCRYIRHYRPDGTAVEEYYDIYQ